MRTVGTTLRLVIGLLMIAIGTLLVGANLNLLEDFFQGGWIMMAFLVIFIYIGVSLLPKDENVRKLFSKRKAHRDDHEA
jgi:hypothetical protein